jgi:hypothetical protein
MVRRITHHRRGAALSLLTERRLSEVSSVKPARIDVPEPANATFDRQDLLVDQATIIEHPRSYIYACSVSQ